MHHTDYHAKNTPVDALDGLSLIKDHVIPLEAVEEPKVLDDDLVACHNHMEASLPCAKVLPVKELAEVLALLGVAPVWHHLQRRGVS